MKAEETAVQAASNPLAVRRGEGLLLVVQNNQEKTLTISGMNEKLEGLLGYAKGEVISRRLETVLGQREAELLADDLEYDDAATDFGDIFSRIRDVRLRRRTGDEIQVNCRLTRLMSENGHACFQIVVPDEHERLAAEKLNSFIAGNLEGRTETDPATGLPNLRTAKEFLPLLKNYFAESNTSVVYAIMRIDRHQKSLNRYGKEACNQLLMHTYHCCRSTFRSKDLIFALSDHTLGIVLFDISRESARMVFNRLRLKIRAQRIAFADKKDFLTSVCISFDVLNLEDAEGTMQSCDEAITGLDANERNALIELGAV